MVRGPRQQLGAGALSFSRAAAEYWTEERPLLAKPQQVSAFMQQVDTLRDDVARLEQRIKRLDDVDMEGADMSALVGHSGDVSTRKGYAVVVRGLSPNNKRRPHSKN